MTQNLGNYGVHGVHGVDGVHGVCFIYLHCRLAIQELNGVEGIVANYGASCDWLRATRDHTHVTPMCHVGVVTWCLSANHSSPHSGPILSDIS